MQILNGNPEEIRKLLKYPATVDFRVIVDSGVADALDQVKKLCDAIEPGQVMALKGLPRPSRTGRYLSFTLPVKVSSYENLHRIYNEVGALSCVKHIL